MRALAAAMLMACVPWRPTFAAEGVADAEAYLRAEQLMKWNASRSVRNDDIETHWIGETDLFWYRLDLNDGKRFLLVNAANGSRAPAFDHGRLAKLIMTAGSGQIDADHLPFDTFAMSADARAIRFEAAGAHWTCALPELNCAREPATPTAATDALRSGELVSPNGLWSAFSKDGNLWLRPKAGDSAPLTTDGTESFAYAATPQDSTHFISDLRGLSRRPAELLWSPNSRFLLAHRLDERQVRELHLIQSHPGKGESRPRLFSYRYGLPGDPRIPVAAPIVFDVETHRRIDIATDPQLATLSSPISFRYNWWSADSRSIYMIEHDRLWKTLTLKVADAATGHCRTLLTETSRTRLQPSATWSEYARPSVRDLASGDFIWFSERDGWGHLYYYQKSGRLRNRITRGHWVVREIVKVDEPHRLIYFLGSGREGGDPYYQRLYSVHFDGSGLRLLTPEPEEHQLRPDDGDQDRAAFSPSGHFFIYSASTPNREPRLFVSRADGSARQLVERADTSVLDSFHYHPVETFEALAADQRTPIYGNIYRPANFDPRLRYPVIDAVYPGPFIIRTPKTFKASLFDSAHALAQLGFIVVTIDGRGTAFRSKAFLDESYGRLDLASNLEDHMAALRQLAAREPSFDLDRVGIYGGSGGGYASAHALLAYPDFYKVGVSISGNHDQRGYISLYGEMFIGDAGEAAYDKADNSLLAGRLRGRLLLMHGELDDNVSPSLTLKLADALIQANKDFDLLIVPNANHQSMFSNPYVIRRMWDYFVRNLQQSTPARDFRIRECEGADCRLRDLGQ